MSWTNRQITTNDGLRLHLRDYAPHLRTRPPLLCLAGLTRNAADFTGIAQALSTGPDARRVIAMDARGRGKSDYDPNPAKYTPLIETNDVLDCLTALDIHEVAVLGTSRGGILAMIMGAMRPACLRAVILNDVGPTIETSGLLRIKAYLGMKLSFASWPDAIAAMKHGAGAQFPDLSDAQWQSFAEAIFCVRDGRITGNYDPDLGDNLKEIDATTPAVNLWPQFEGLKALPVMAIRGALSDILLPQTLAAMAAMKPDMVIHEVPNEGHAPLLNDAPTIAAIRAFLNTHSA